MSCYPLQVVSRMVMNRSGEVFYIGGNDILPAPLSAEREAEVIEMLGTEKEKEGKSVLIEHNLRLVVYIAKKFDNTGVGVEDLKLGRIDAYANTTTNVNAFTHNNTDAKFRFFDEQLLANNVAYFLQKTDDGDKLTKELDDVIQDMLDDGTVAKITEKWMYADMTKLIQK